MQIEREKIGSGGGRCVILEGVEWVVLLVVVVVVMDQIAVVNFKSNETKRAMLSSRVI